MEIVCPKCSHSFELTDALAAPLVEAARREAITASDIRIEDALKKQRAEIIDAAERAQADVVAALKAETKAASDNERLMSSKLATAQAAQAEALRKTRELDDARRELELTIERRTSDKLQEIRRAVEADAEGRIGAKLAERDLQIESLKKASEELQRKLTQGSMQVQGEAQEVELERALAAKFPQDVVEPVGKGISGGDCLLVVAGVGRILFESKNTKAWSGAWLPKLRDDGRAASADLLVLVTQALHKDVETFDLVEGVWVCSPKYAIPLTVALRQALCEAAQARAAGQGLETKAGLVYTYLTGQKFKSRISAIVEAFTVMKDDLESERRAITKQWAKRDAQIERVLQGTVGMYGDLQAIAGKSLAEIEGLELLS